MSLFKLIIVIAITIPFFVIPFVFLFPPFTYLVLTFNIVLLLWIITSSVFTFLFSYHRHIDVTLSECLSEILWKIAPAVLFYFGFAIMGILAVSFEVIQPRYFVVIFFLIFAFLVFRTVIYSIRIWTILYKKPSLEKALIDNREYILVLRPFESDIYDEQYAVEIEESDFDSQGHSTTRIRRHALFADNLFDSILEKIAKYAVVFVGGKTGISNCYDLVSLSDDWREIVHKLMADAKAILFIPGTGPSLSVEFERIINEYLDKTLLVMPPSLSKHMKGSLVFKNGSREDNSLTRELRWKECRELSFSKFNFYLPPYNHEGGFYRYSNFFFKKIKYHLPELDKFLTRIDSKNHTLSEALHAHFDDSREKETAFLVDSSEAYKETNITCPECQSAFSSRNISLDNDLAQCANCELTFNVVADFVHDWRASTEYNNGATGKLFCKKCKSKVRFENIDIHNDIAQCDSCTNQFKLTDYFQQNADSDRGTNQLTGVSVTKQENAVILEASCGKTESAGFRSLFIWSLVWSIFLIVFSVVIFNAFTMHEIFPTIVSVFFIAVLVYMTIKGWEIALKRAFGKIQLTLDSEGGEIVTNAKFLNSSKAFKWDDVNDVREKIYFERSGEENGHIELNCQKTIKFGDYLLSSTDRSYIFSFIQRIMNERRLNPDFNVQDLKSLIVK